MFLPDALPRSDNSSESCTARAHIHLLTKHMNIIARDFFPECWVAYPESFEFYKGFPPWNTPSTKSTSNQTLSSPTFSVGITSLVWSCTYWQEITSIFIVCKSL